MSVSQGEIDIFYTNIQYFLTQKCFDTIMIPSLNVLNLNFFSTFY